MPSSPFKITLFDKNLVRTGWLNNPTALTATPRHNGIGTATITVTSDHRKIPQLSADGARAVIEYYGEHLMSGYITEASGSGPTLAGEFTFTLNDDLWLMWRLLGWPAPGSAINAQGTKQDTRTGAAETVVKAFLTANLARNTVDPIVVAPSTGRGSTITASSRMKILADVLMDQVDKAGIGLSAKQVGSSIVLDAYTPQVYPHTLSEAAGTIINWSWSKKTPTMTNAIAGGPNTDTSREFRLRTDTTRQALLGYTIEGFVDAQSAENYAAMDAAADTGLADAGPKAGFAVELSETKNFRYGGPRGVHVGDIVPVDIGGQIMTDVLREATISWTVDGNLEVKPTIGEHSDDPDTTLYGFVGAIGRRVRELGTR